MTTVHALPVQVGLEVFSHVLREKLHVLGLHTQTSTKVIFHWLPPPIRSSAAGKWLHTQSLSQV